MVDVGGQSHTHATCREISSWFIIGEQYMVHRSLLDTVSLLSICSLLWFCVSLFPCELVHVFI